MEINIKYSSSFILAWDPYKMFCSFPTLLSLLRQAGRRRQKFGWMSSSMLLERRERSRDGAPEQIEISQHMSFEDAD